MITLYANSKRFFRKRKTLPDEGVVPVTKNEHYSVLEFLYNILTLIQLGLLGVRFTVGGKITPCLKLVRIMQET